MSSSEENDFNNIIKEREEKKKTSFEISEEQYWQKVEEWRSLPLLRCPYCKFRSVYKKVVVEHHIKYTHGLGHPVPPNVRLLEMCQKDHMDWQDAWSNKTSRRSNVPLVDTELFKMKMVCICKANPISDYYRKCICCDLP